MTKERMMRSKFEVDKNEPKSKKDEFFKKIRDTVPKASVAGNTVEIASADEAKVTSIFTATGLKYKKIA
jgi:hypothetical protein